MKRVERVVYGVVLVVLATGWAAAERKAQMHQERVAVIQGRWQQAHTRLATIEQQFQEMEAVYPTDFDEIQTLIVGGGVRQFIKILPTIAAQPERKYVMVSFWGDVYPPRLLVVHENGELADVIIFDRPVQSLVVRADRVYTETHPIIATASPPTEAEQ